MGAYAYPMLADNQESLKGKLLLSVIMHGLLFASIIGYTYIGPGRGPGWGSNLEGGIAIHMNAVTTIPALPLPAPPVTTPNTVAVENPGLYKTEPTPKPKPVPEAVKIQKFKEAVKPEPPVKANKRIQKQAFVPPMNAIPFGQQGKPAMNYAPVLSQGGQGGLSFGGSFGDRYGWYVDAVRSRISGNWLVSTISPNILSAPRVYVDFDILRDGTITNAHVTQSSGIPEVDRTALRAVLASNPVGALPADYSGSKVSVDFYFDFRR